MKSEDFDEIFIDQIRQCEKMLTRKGNEYADEDRLSNFKKAACLQNTTPKNALGGMFAKHVVSIFDLIKENDPAPMEIWDEKIGDALNYLFLLKAVVIEETIEKGNINVKTNH